MERLTKSLEDYMEAVYVLEQRDGFARISSLSELLKVKKPSVNSAAKLLKSRDLIEHERYGYIKLTPRGRALAKDIFSSHNDIKELLSEVLGVCESDAASQACEIEHVINERTHRKIADFVSFVKSDARIYSRIKDFKGKDHEKNGSY
ncbi:MAG: metal-dependent transcriptional regulator [Elusimicrobia bacterium CG08_land_8_20_14_0_20_51_18]|nr:MAG: metal-dependent transcriptional regulator [Elusimicrobia bacterium CG08_land_8_20_14_0_20_51_18]